MTWKTGVLLVLFCALASARGAEAQSTYKETTVRNGGSITGRVVLDGKAPAEEPLAITKDRDYCGKATPASRLVAGKDGGVKDAVVYLEGITEGKRFPVRKHVVLDQRNCEFEPHIVILGVNDQLEVVNSDPVLHNVHAYNLGEKQTLFNVAQPLKGHKSSIAPVQFRNASSVLTTCDAGHPWMTGYIVRTAHPYYVTTDASGRFTLDNVPPGTYKLTFWHEGVAVKRIDKEKGVPTKYVFEDPYTGSMTVTVVPKGEARADFALKLRS